ncbi:hypothetical protein HYDPIDRAFT_113061 [Hydnomerulius pinastri MD-312]|uniref:Nudix hydrolase domain-containing protein n=1 Tax=Hydnomerulius pinastri MD-312 TaxID=994086 RepID=A0A0C9WE40_9AGAM|nr:hypothetical protein HYDPIDRAFT_113061 [Hydnomerulius pinastri MD-312]
MAQTYVLPKGLKDCGETTAEAAIRETHEATGYRCKLLACTMITRAPEPNVNMIDAPHVVKDATEPFAMTLGSLRKEGGTRITWWYLTIVTDGAKREETQADEADACSEFIEVREAIETLTFQDDKEVARKALSLLEGSEMDPVV